MRDAILILVAGDIIISILSVYAGFAVRFEKFPAFNDLLFSESPQIALFSLITIFMTFFGGLYKYGDDLGKKMLFVQIASMSVLSFFALSALYYLAPLFVLGRGVLISSLAVFCIFQYLWHVLYKLCLNLPGIAKRVLILGSGPLAEKIGSLISSNARYYVLAGYVNCTDGPHHVPANRVICSCDELFQAARMARVNQIVVSLSEQRGTMPMRGMLDCKLNGIDVVDAASFYEVITGKLLIENMRPSSLIYAEGFRVTPLVLFMKRAADILLSTVGLILALPLIPLIALLIRLDSPGPVFYRQVRVGQGEKNFVLYKFRTMKEDAEAHSGAVWAEENDSRVTRAGTFLRKTRLDEIPQLFNVMRGDISFIGPRPERPEFVGELKKLIPYYSERHFIKPGLTGWAQVRYPYGSSVEDAVEKLKYDLYYLKNLSFILDMTIILDTIKVVLFAKGGR